MSQDFSERLTRLSEIARVKTAVVEALYSTGGNLSIAEVILALTEVLKDCVSTNVKIEWDKLDK